MLFRSAALARDAERLGAVLVTTRKDAVRLPESIRAKVSVIDIEVDWHDEQRLEAWLGAVSGQ